MTTVTPSGSWNGTAGSGGAAPTASGTPHGSGWTKMAGGGILNFERSWIEAGDLVGVAADTNDPAAWIDYVEFEIEGGTPVKVYDCTKHPVTGEPAFWIEPQSPTGVNGDANIYARIVPVNGLERLASRRIVLNTSETGKITRARRYVSTTGNDSASGESGSPWLTLGKALSSAPDGSIVEFGVGTWKITSFSANNNTREIEFRGAGKGQTIFQPLEGGSWDKLFRHDVMYLNFSNCTIEADEILQLYGRSVSGSWTTLRDAEVAHSAGPLGFVSLGYPEGTTPPQSANLINQFFRHDEGQIWGFDNVDIINPLAGNGNIERRTRKLVGCDVVIIDSGSNYIFLNVDAWQKGMWECRVHTEINLTVASASYNSGNGRTTITFSGSPNLTGARDFNTYLRVLQSDNVAVGNVQFPRNCDGTQDMEWLGWRIPTDGNGDNLIDNGAKTITVIGDLSALQAGDICRGYYMGHGDALQWVKADPLYATRSNFIFQNYRAESSEWQIALPQPGDETNFTGTTTSSGTTVTLASAQAVAVGDYVAPTTGGQAYVWKRVTAIAGGGAVGTVSSFTIESAWASDQSGTIRRTRTIEDVYLSNCILNVAGATDVLGQCSPMLNNWGIWTTTAPGWSPSNLTWQWVNNATGGRVFNVNVGDSIYRSMSSDGSWPSGVAVQNSHFETGTDRNDSGGSTGIIWSSTDRYAPYDAGYYPPEEAGVATVTSVRFPFDINGNAREVGDPVGAVAKQGTPPDPGTVAGFDFSQPTPVLAGEWDGWLGLEDANGDPVAAPANISGSYTITKIS